MLVTDIVCYECHMFKKGLIFFCIAKRNIYFPILMHSYLIYRLKKNLVETTIYL